ncbi:molybdopterin molybdotransferase MoeA [Daejeonella lutea]|uniref:Molybdopterin molybdenumtransferase n=1 Tax=Daejeonella lutea TaxID=572036 RepID=A0A1T4ZWZ3_9SPHI|nr:gephyrin-like molybdotransferase Glp [Daejeonella lutea]SKB27294.1 molybdopterin molybdotransferase [Daejeonella lutea]
MPSEFISVQEARDLIEAHIQLLSPVNVSLMDAGGLVIAEDVFAKTDVPPFNQSSMDGYAINYNGWQATGELTIYGEVAAGSTSGTYLQAHTAARIFTGAAVPDGADTVVMQEKVRVDGNKLLIEDESLVQGLNFRAKGSEIKSGAIALEKGSLMTPASIGYLAGVGIENISAYPRPSVAVILTGDELQAPGKSLVHGQVYESNSFALNAALKQAGVSQIKFYSSADTLAALTGVIREALDQADVVLLTGGVSVGDYDFVIRAASANDVEQIFHKIRQKPGKPLFFGKKGQKVVFGLPGNPASVLSCYYEYVLPALGQMSSRKTALESRTAPLKTSLKKPAGLTQFLKGYYDGISASDLKAQESFRLSSFAKANCLIRLEEGRAEYSENELVEIHLLPEYYG